MISPKYFGETSYESVVQTIVETNRHYAPTFKIVIKRVSDETVELNTVECKRGGKFHRISLETTFSLTEESIQTGIMTMLSHQVDKGWYEGFLIVSENREAPIFETVFDLREAVNCLSEARKAHPSERIYLEPVRNSGNALSKKIKRLFFSKK